MKFYDQRFFCRVSLINSDYNFFIMSSFCALVECLAAVQKTFLVFHGLVQGAPEHVSFEPPTTWQSIAQRPAPVHGEILFSLSKKGILRFITFKANLESRIIKLDCGAKRRAFRIINLDLFAITHWFESLSTY